MTPTADAIAALQDLQASIRRAQAALSFVYTTIESATANSLGTLAAAYQRAHMLLQDLEAKGAA